MKRRCAYNYLRRLRKERGLSQKKVAEILGLKSSSMISRWEHGVSMPDTVNALKMSALYQTTVDSIYEDLRRSILDELSVKLESLPQAEDSHDE